MVNKCRRCSKKPIKNLKYCSKHRAEVKERGRLRRQNDLQRVRLYELNCKHRMRCKALLRLGDKCVKCGFSDWRALQIDHKKGGGRKEQRKIGSDGIRQNVLRMKNPKSKYQLLCANCNWIKRCERMEYNI